MRIARKRVLCWDAGAWVVALTPPMLLSERLFERSPGKALSIFGLAVVAHVGLGLARGLYDAPPDVGHWRWPEFNSAAVVVGLVAALLLAFTVVAGPPLPSVRVTMTSAVAAAALTLGPRYAKLIRGEQRRDRRRDQEKRWPIGQALPLAEDLARALEANDAVLRCAYGGSVRRMQATIGDIELVAATERPTDVIEAFGSLAATHHVWIERELETHKKVRASTAEGIRVELTIVPPGSYGAGLQYATGPRLHTRQLRRRALLRRCRLPFEPADVKEHWLFRLTSRFGGNSGTLETEEAVYQRLGLPWIPPTLRQGKGEVKAAAARRLPRLIGAGDIRGELHARPSSARGFEGVAASAFAAWSRGYEYVALTLPWGPAGLSDESSMLRCQEQIRALNAEFRGRFVVLPGVEADIGPNGEVECPEDVLRGCDVVVASIHDDRGQDPAATTRRLLRAMEHPRVNILGHPTGRRVGDQEPRAFDFDEVCRAAVRHGVGLEVNGHPGRLDLTVEHLQQSRQYEVPLVVSAGARTSSDLSHMRYGVATAQRGWASPERVVNTWPLERLQDFLGHRSTVSRS